MFLDYCYNIIVKFECNIKELCKHKHKRILKCKCQLNRFLKNVSVQTYKHNQKIIPPPQLLIVLIQL
jgi:hypothetical protein